MFFFKLLSMMVSFLHVFSEFKSPLSESSFIYIHINIYVYTIVGYLIELNVVLHFGMQWPHPIPLPPTPFGFSFVSSPSPPDALFVANSLPLEY